MKILKSKGGRFTAVFLGTGGVISLFIIILIFIRHGINRELSTEIKSLSNSIDEIQSVTSDELRFSREIEEAEKKFVLVLKKLPKEAQIPDALDQLTDAIGELNLKLISIIPKEPVGIVAEEAVPLLPTEEKPRPDYMQIPIEITMQGRYEAIGKYLDLLRYLARLITVDEINIEKKSEDVLDVVLQVSVWYSEG